MSLEIVISGLAVVVSIIAITISYWSSRRARILAIRPVLLFVWEHGGQWTLVNVGNGPGLDVVIAKRGETHEWLNPSRIRPLAKDGSFDLNIMVEFGLGCVYTDIHGRSYTSIVDQENKTSLYNGRRLTKWNEEDISPFFY